MRIMAKVKQMQILYYKMPTINNYLDKDYSLKYLSGVGGRMKNRAFPVTERDPPGCPNCNKFMCCGGNCPDNY